MVNITDIDSKITKSSLDALEVHIDNVFNKIGIDVEFTRHFLDRVNDERNGKQITIRELGRLFAKEYKRWGRPIAQMGPDKEAVMKDLESDINIPFVLKWNRKTDQLELVAKTVMRKKNFKSPDREFPVESVDQVRGSEPLPKKSKPSTTGMQQHPYKGRLVGEAELSEDLGSIPPLTDLIVMAVVGQTTVATLKAAFKVGKNLVKLKKLANRAGVKLADTVMGENVDPAYDWMSKHEKMQEYHINAANAARKANDQKLFQQHKDAALAHRKAELQWERNTNDGKALTMSQGAMQLSKQLNAPQESIEESNPFTDARMNAIKAGKKEFTVKGKTYPITGDTSDEEEAIKNEAVNRNELQSKLAARASEKFYDSALQALHRLVTNDPRGQTVGGYAFDIARAFQGLNGRQLEKMYKQKYGLSEDRITQVDVEDDWNPGNVGKDLLMYSNVKPIGKLGPIYLYQKKIGVMNMSVFITTNPLSIESNAEVIIKGELLLTKNYTEDSVTLWQVKGTSLDKSLRGKGLMPKIYAYLIKKGFFLRSDTDQSKGGMKIWAALSKVPGITVYAASEDVHGNMKYTSLEGDDKLAGDFPIYKNEGVDEYTNEIKTTRSQIATILAQSEKVTDPAQIEKMQADIDFLEDHVRKLTKERDKIYNDDSLSRRKQEIIYVLAVADKKPNNESINEVSSVDLPKSWGYIGQADWRGKNSKYTRKIGKLGGFNVVLEQYGRNSRKVFLITDKNENSALNYTPVMLIEFERDYGNMEGMEYWIAKATIIHPSWQGKGLAPKVYAYLCKKGWVIRSDDLQSAGGKKIWISLSKIPGITVYAGKNDGGNWELSDIDNDVDDFLRSNFSTYDSELKNEVKEVERELNFVQNKIREIWDDYSNTDKTDTATLARLKKEYTDLRAMETKLRDEMSDTQSKQTWNDEHEDVYLFAHATHDPMYDKPKMPARESVKKNEKIAENSNIQIKPVSVSDHYKGETFGTKYLYVDNVIKAGVDVSLYGDEVYISHIVTADDSKRKGYARMLVNDLFKEFPNKKVIVSNMTDDGSAFFRSQFNVNDETGEITPKMNEEIETVRVSKDWKSYMWGVPINRYYRKYHEVEPMGKFRVFINKEGTEYDALLCDKNAKMQALVHMTRRSAKAPCVVHAAALNPELQGKGIMPKFYAHLITKIGMFLQADSMQSAGGRKIWVALSKNPEVTVYATYKENGVEKYSHVEGDNLLYSDAPVYDEERDENVAEIKNEITSLENIIDRYTEQQYKVKDEEEYKKLSQHIYELTRKKNDLKKEYFEILPKKPKKAFTKLLAVPAKTPSMESVTEAFNTQVEWVTGYEADDGVIYATKINDAYIELKIGLDQKTNTAYVTFTRGHSYGVTGEGSQMQILGAVVNKIVEEVKAKQIDTIKFSASKPQGNFGAPIESRSKLYTKMANKIAAQLNYEVHVDKSSYLDEFTITRKKNGMTETIRKVKGGYQLRSKDGKKNLGTYPTKTGAQKREKQVQYFKHMNESYKLQLERDDDLYVLHIMNTDNGKRTEVRGKANYETNGYDANDKLHQLLDTIGKTANISELMNGEVVTINPKHPDGAKAKSATDKAFSEDAAKEPDVTGYQHDLLTMPQHTLVIDTKGDLDWYKLGQHFARLNQQDPHEFGQGDTDMVVTLANRDQVDRLKRMLDKFGATYKEIGGSPEHPEIHSESELNELKIVKPHPDDTLGVPRRHMPQIDEKHYEDLFKYIYRNGGKITKEKVDPANLMSTQSEFSDKGVEAAMTNGKMNKPIIISSDNYVLDGHHRWLAAKNAKIHDITAFKINLPAKEGLSLLINFPQTTFKDIHEAFNSPLEWEWVTTRDDLYKAIGYISDNRRLIITIEEDDKADEWSIMFSATDKSGGQSTRVTNMGSEFQIFSTVIAVLQDWWNTHKETADVVKFTSWQRETTRVKLYNSLAKKMANMTGFHMDVYNEGPLVHFALHRYGMNESAGVGKIVKGVNTTVDVGPNEIAIQSAKFGNKVSKDGKPYKKLRENANQIPDDQLDKILSNPRVSVGLKLPRNATIWRGISDQTGSGMATYGTGLYTTTSKAHASKFGKVTKMEPDALPDFPLRFDSHNDYQIWLQQAQKVLGFSDNRDFVKVYDDIRTFVHALGDFGGIQIGKGRDIMFVKYYKDGRPKNNLREAFDKVYPWKWTKKTDRYWAAKFNEGAYDSITFKQKRQQLNVPYLIQKGAIYITDPHGPDGWEPDSEGFSLLTLYNVKGGGWQGEAKQHLKPSEYANAAKMINAPLPASGNNHLVYDGKYNQILWSIKKLGLGKEAFLGNVNEETGVEMPKIFRNMLTEAQLQETMLDSVTKWLGNNASKTIEDLSNSILTMKDAAILIKDILTDNTYFETAYTQMVKASRGMLKQLNSLMNTAIGLVNNENIANTLRGLVQNVITFASSIFKRGGIIGFLGSLGVYAFTKYMVQNLNNAQTIIKNVINSDFADQFGAFISTVMNVVTEKLPGLTFFSFFDNLNTVKELFFEVLGSIKRKLDFGRNLNTNAA